MGIVTTEVVVKHTPAFAYQRDTQLLIVETAHHVMERSDIELLFAVYRLMHLGIEIFEPLLQQPYFILFFPGLLEDDESHREDQKQRENRQVELISHRDGPHLFEVFVHSLSIFYILSRLSEMILCIEIITKSQSCDDALGKTPDLLSEPRDVDIDRAVQHEHIFRPYLVDQLLA